MEVFLLKNLINYKKEMKKIKRLRNLYPNQHARPFLHTLKKNIIEIKQIKIKFFYVLKKLFGKVVVE